MPAVRSAIVLAGLLMTATTPGCFTPAPDKDYGPSLKEAGRVTLADSERVAAESQRDAIEQTKQEAELARLKTSAASATMFAGDLASALQEAQAAGSKRKVFLLLVSDTCPGCADFEALCAAPEVMREAKDRWLFARANVDKESRYLADFRVTKADLPVAILVSAQGNENHRITKRPSSGEVLAFILNDKF